MVEKRTIQRISQDVKANVMMLLSVQRRLMDIERDLTLALVEIINLEKELERYALD